MADRPWFARRYHIIKGEGVRVQVNSDGDFLLNGNPVLSTSSAPTFDVHGTWSIDNGATINSFSPGVNGPSGPARLKVQVIQDLVIIFVLPFQIPSITGSGNNLIFTPNSWTGPNISSDSFGFAQVTINGVGNGLPIKSTNTPIMTLGSVPPTPIITSFSLDANGAYATFKV